MLQRVFDHVGLSAADEDGFGADERGVVKRLRQSDGHIAGYGIDKAAALVDKPPLQHAQKVEDRKLVNMA